MLKKKKSFIFKTTMKRRRSVYEIPNREKPYKCSAWIPDCNCRYPNLHSLNRHLWSKHDIWNYSIPQPPSSGDSTSEAEGSNEDSVSYVPNEEDSASHFSGESEGEASSSEGSKSEEEKSTVPGEDGDSDNEGMQSDGYQEESEEKSLSFGEPPKINNNSGKLTSDDEFSLESDEPSPQFKERSEEVEKPRKYIPVAIRTIFDIVVSQDRKHVSK